MAHKSLQRPARGVDTRAAMDGTIVQKDSKIIRIILIRITDARRRDCIRPTAWDFAVPSQRDPHPRQHDAELLKQRETA